MAKRKSGTTTYTLPEAVSVEMPDQFGERFAWSHEAGEVSPASEREEYILAHLLRLGYAQRAAAPKAKE